MNDEIWELWSTRTSNLMEEFATEGEALTAVAQILAEFGPTYLHDIVLLRGPINGDGEMRPVASGADLVALVQQVHTETDHPAPNPR